MGQPGKSLDICDSDVNDRIGADSSLPLDYTCTAEFRRRSSRVVRRAFHPATFLKNRQLKVLPAAECRSLISCEQMKGSFRGKALLDGFSPYCAIEAAEWKEGCARRFTDFWGVQHDLPAS